MARASWRRDDLVTLNEAIEAIPLAYDAARELVTSLDCGFILKNKTIYVWGDILDALRNRRGSPAATGGSHRTAEVDAWLGRTNRSRSSSGSSGRTRKRIESLETGSGTG